MNLMAIAFFLAMAISLALTPGVGFLALKAKVMDVPRGERHAHERAVPLLGGIAIFVAFAVTVFMRMGVTGWVRGLLAGSSFIMAVGIIDDVKELRPIPKFLGQAVGAVIMVAMGVRMEFVSNPFGGIIQMGWLSYPFSVIWILSFVNAINLIDGLDGLASGVVGIGSLSLGIIAFTKGYIDVALLSVILAGSCFGFLWHNFNPAQIFMGDAGALFIGSAMGGISAAGAIKGPATLTIAVPVVILGVAVVDTLLAIVRRTANRTSIGTGDYDHFHYWLRKKGLSVRGAVLTIYALTIVLSVTAYLISRQESTPIGWFIAFSALVLLIIGGAFAGMIKFRKFSEWIARRRGQSYEEDNGSVRDQAGHDKDDAGAGGDQEAS